MNRPTVVLLGPHRDAVSGVSTHVNMLLGSRLAEEYEVVHYQVGSEGRTGEGPLGRLLRLAWSPFGLFLTLLFRHASVLHVNTAMNPKAFWRDLAYVIVGRLAFARILYQVHGGDLPEDFTRGRPWRRRFLRFALRQPDLVVLLASRELEAYRAFVPGQAMAIFPNAVEPHPYLAVRTVERPADAPLRAIFMGRLARAKGLYESLQAVRIAHELGADVRLVVAGSGPEEDRLKRYAQALGVAGRVQFAGEVHGEDKVRLLAGADVMLLPSYGEGLPYALLESMAAGVPVIATPVGGIPDVMTHVTHGLIVPVGDAKAIAEALAILAGDRERLAWMSRACRRRILAAYTVERLAAEFSLAYAHLHGGAALETAGGTSMPPRPAPARPSRSVAELGKD